jgi:acyl-CoA synthetase (AMP-forming)/AMP-acid ligase II
MILSTPERIEEYTQKGWWGTLTIDDYFRQNVERTPDKVAIVDPLDRTTWCDGEPRRLTYSQLDEEIDRLSAILVKCGVGVDDVVAIQLPNTVELVAAYLAIMRIGAIATPFPVQYRAYEQEELLRFVEAKAMITSTRLGDRKNAESVLGLQAVLPDLKTILAWGQNVPQGVVSLDEWMRLPLDEELLNQRKESVSITANDIFTICWTSGTEGKPKGVPRSHNEWFISAFATVDGAQFTDQDVLLNPFPMVNMAGIGGMMLPWLMSGATLVQHHPFHLPTFLSQIALEKVTYTLAPPSILGLLLQNESYLAQTDISTLRMIGSGSTPLSPWLLETWKEKHGIDIINYFGSNEGATFIGVPQDIPDPKMRARYFPRFGVEGFSWSLRPAQRMYSKLVDMQTGQEVTEPGRPGEMRLKGASIFSGYWRAEELTKRAFDEEGYFCTGDVFEIAGDSDGLRYYSLVGRAKDVIIRGGMNISPEELESLLMSHPKLAEVSVVGYPDDVLGEKVCACVVLRPEQRVTLEELVDFLRQKEIASFKLPERLVTLDSLPRNPVGKILKQPLRALLQEQSIDPLTT